MTRIILRGASRDRRCAEEGDNGPRIGGTAQNPSGVATLSLSVCDPPTQADVIAIVDKMNELINAL